MAESRAEREGRGDRGYLLHAFALHALDYLGLYFGLFQGLSQRQSVGSGCVLMALPESGDRWSSGVEEPCEVKRRVS